jgi:hypothetical protein
MEDGCLPLDPTEYGEPPQKRHKKDSTPIRCKDHNIAIEKLRRMIDSLSDEIGAGEILLLIEQEEPGVIPRMHKNDWGRISSRMEEAFASGSFSAKTATRLVCAMLRVRQEGERGPPSSDPSVEAPFLKIICAALNEAVSVKDLVDPANAFMYIFKLGVPSNDRADECGLVQTAAVKLAIDSLLRAIGRVYPGGVDVNSSDDVSSNIVVGKVLRNVATLLIDADYGVQDIEDKTDDTAIFNLLLLAVLKVAKVDRTRRTFIWLSSLLRDVLCRFFGSFTLPEEVASAAMDACIVISAVADAGDARASRETIPHVVYVMYLAAASSPATALQLVKFTRGTQFSPDTDKANIFSAATIHAEWIGKERFSEFRSRVLHTILRMDFGAMTLCKLHSVISSVEMMLREDMDEGDEVACGKVFNMVSSHPYADALDVRKILSEVQVRVEANEGRRRRAALAEASMIS